MSAGNPFSRTDLAAIKAIAAANKVTNDALAELARALAARQPGELRPKRSRRVTRMTQSAGGDLTVEYSDGSAKRLHLSRDDAGDLVAEEIDPVAEAAPAPAADAGSTEAAPEPGGMFDGIFGSPPA
jgi:hypothetical protein